MRQGLWSGVTATVWGAAPAGTVAMTRFVWVLITESVPSSWFVTYTCPPAWARAAASGTGPAAAPAAQAASRPDDSRTPATPRAGWGPLVIWRGIVAHLRLGLRVAGGGRLGRRG